MPSLDMVDGVTFEHLTGEQARRRSVQFGRLYAEIYAEPPYQEGPVHVARFVDDFVVQCSATGFALVRALAPGGEMIGMAYGRTLSPDRWFAASTAPPPEIEGRSTFAVMEWMVRKPWRRRGIGTGLLTMVLDHRPERWSVLMSNPAAPARALYSRLGWRGVGSSRPADFPEMEILALPLPPPAWDFGHRRRTNDQN